MFMDDTNIGKQTIGSIHLGPGYHEVEVETCEIDLGEEAALQDKRKKCKKNPGHTGFIPVTEFSLEHLPEIHREQLYLDFIKAVIDLTVRLVVTKVGCGRPDNYHLSNVRGKNIRSVGSGAVRELCRKFTKIDDESCPCRHCKTLPDKDRKKQWGKFNVWTARHVVFDDEESRHTQVDVDYNRDTDKDTCLKLYGVGMDDTMSHQDKCWMSVVSHDREVCLMLEERLKHFDDVRQILFENKVGYRISSNGLIVCVSHPHGMSKQVSVGEYLGRQESFPFRWRYSACTCPGSSGAPVCCMAEVRERGILWVKSGNVTHHSGYNGNEGGNESGRW